MTKQGYTIEIHVNASAKEAFKSINEVTKWWTEHLEGKSQKLNDEFTVTFGDVHVSTQRLIEVIPDKKVTWLVTGSKLTFIKDQQEWNNTTITFELLPQDTHTTLVRFTHFGLIPKVECYRDCTKGWDYYIKGSLFKLLNEGKGTPEKK